MFNLGLHLDIQNVIKYFVPKGFEAVWIDLIYPPNDLIGFFTRLEVVSHQMSENY